MNRQLLKNIRSLRHQHGLNQKEIGERIGANQASYARFESGARKTDFGTLEKISEVFEVDVCTLIHFHEVGFNDGNKGAGPKDEEVSQLRERTEYLQRLNEQLLEQVRDKEEVIGYKEEVIGLLRSR